MNNFTESSLRALLEAIQDRTALFPAMIEDRWVIDPAARPIYLRFDIDDNIDKAHKISLICNEYGIRATFFMLNTASYWGKPSSMHLMAMIQAMGHEIGWHNNVLTEYCSDKQVYNHATINHLISRSLERLRSNDLNIRGSASHGDPLCHKLGYINYEVFTECPRTQEAAHFPQSSFTIPKVSMHSFGLEYEAYHVPYDLYLSESGGKEWRGRAKDTTFKWRIDELNLGLLSKHDRIQILIHPQHWKI